MAASLLHFPGVYSPELPSFVLRSQADNGGKDRPAGSVMADLGGSGAAVLCAAHWWCACVVAPGYLTLSHVPPSPAIHCLLGVLPPSFQPALQRTPPLPSHNGPDSAIHPPPSLITHRPHHITHWGGEFPPLPVLVILLHKSWGQQDTESKTKKTSTPPHFTKMCFCFVCVPIGEICDHFLSL